MGFGEFQVRWGIGAYEEESNSQLRRVSAYEKAEILAYRVRFSICNRMSYGISTLKIGTFFPGKEDNKTSTLADCIPATVAEMENRYLSWRIAIYPILTWSRPGDTRSFWISRSAVSGIKTWRGLLYSARITIPSGKKH